MSTCDFLRKDPKTHAILNMPHISDATNQVYHSDTKTDEQEVWDCERAKHRCTLVFKSFTETFYSEEAFSGVEAEVSTVWDECYPKLQQGAASIPQHSTPDPANPGYSSFSIPVALPPTSQVVPAAPSPSTTPSTSVDVKKYLLTISSCLMRNMFLL